MNKKLLSILTFALLGACSSSHSNYYLKEYEIKENLQGKTTSEVIFNNVIYAKILEDDLAKKFLGPDIDDYSIVFFKAKNLGSETAYFKFDDAQILDEDEDFTKIIKVSNLISSDSVDFSEIDEYSNPFIHSEMEENNFAYNLNKRVLTNFALTPKSNKEGFIIFKKLRKPTDLEFYITSGTSIYTARSYKIKLDK